MNYVRHGRCSSALPSSSLYDEKVVDGSGLQGAERPSSWVVVWEVGWVIKRAERPVARRASVRNQAVSKGPRIRRRRTHNPLLTLNLPTNLFSTCPRGLPGLYTKLRDGHPFHIHFVMSSCLPSQKKSESSLGNPFDRPGNLVQSTAPSGEPNPDPTVST